MNFEKIQQLLSQLKPITSTNLRPPSSLEREYFTYYHIDFETQIEGLSHFVGTVESGQYKLFCHYYKNTQVAEEADGKTVFIVHGLFDHAGLFANAIGYFLMRGFNVVIFDLPGHGLSSGEPTAIESFDDYAESLKSVIDFFAPVCKPNLLLGQSTGCAAILNALLRERISSCDAVILLAPLIRPFAWSYLQFFYPALSRTLKYLKRGFTPSSSDKIFLDFLKNKDYLQSKKLSMDWVKAMYEWIENFDSYEQHSQAVLMLQGDQDKTVDWKVNIPKIQEKFPNSKTVYIKEANHHLINESDFFIDKIFLAMDEYLEKNT